MRLSAEETSATTVGSWVIWMSMTLVLTTISVFLASNSLSPFDDRRDADGTGQTTYERWTAKLRLCCTRHGSAHALAVFDSFADSFFDEVDAGTHTDGAAALRLDRADAAANDRHREATKALAELAAERAAEAAASARDRDSGLFSSTELQERAATRQRIAEYRRDQAQHRVRAVIGTGLPEVRAVLSGGDVRSILSFRQAFMRLVALLGTMSAGLMVGGEGPFVLISASIAHSLSRLPPFRWFLQSSPQGALHVFSTAHWSLENQSFHLIYTFRFLISNAPSGFPIAASSSTIAVHCRRGRHCGRVWRTVWRSAVQHRGDVDLLPDALVL